MAQAKGGTLAKAQTLIKPTVSVPSVASTSAKTAGITPITPSTSLGTTVSNIGSDISGTLNNFISSYMDYANQGAAIANAESRAAQERQFAFNSAQAALERQYNTEMWEKNAAFNSAEAELNRKFNEKEAQTNRNWQERMANSTYQREVADLKAAGLNPILAAFNSGSPVGAGAQASGTSASSSYGSGTSASGSNYSGQGHNMSDSLAMIGAIGSMIGVGASAFGSWLNNKDAGWKNLWDAPTFLETLGVIGKSNYKTQGGTNTGGKGNRTYTLNNRR